MRMRSYKCDLKPSAFDNKCNSQRLGCLEPNHVKLNHYFARFFLDDDTCLEHCISYNYLYAIAETGKACYCSRAKLLIKDCYQNCTISDRLCSKNLTLVVYNVTQKVPGVVNNFRLNYSNVYSLGVIWEPPIIKNGVITNYKISLALNQSLDQRVKTDLSSAKIENIYNAKMLQATFRDLSPSSRYLLKIQAINKFGYGIEFIKYVWTRIRIPSIIPYFNIFKNDTMISLNIKFPQNNIGSISAFRIVLCDKLANDNQSFLSLDDSMKYLSNMENKNMIQPGKTHNHDMEHHMLSPITYANQRIPSGLKDCHIVAQLNSSFGQIQDEIRSLSFVIGDNKSYRGFWNRKPTYRLSKENIYVGIVSDLSHYLKNSQDLYVPERNIFYSFQRYQASNSSNFIGPVPSDRPATYYNILVNTVTTLISITILLVLLYVGMRWFYYKRVLASKHAYSNEFSSNNCLSKDIQLSLRCRDGGVNTDDSLLQIMKKCDESTDIDTLIQELVPSELIYPSRSFHFDAQRMMVGLGRFGKVYRGKMHSASAQNIETALLTIPISDFSHSQDGLLEVGKALKIAVATRNHPNFPQFLSLAHDFAGDELWVALENSSTQFFNLRDDILRRKWRDLMKNEITGVAFFKEHIIKSMMQIALGVANGLSCLEEFNIFHPKLAAKNVWVEERSSKGDNDKKTCVIKIGGLGFHDYSCNPYGHHDGLSESKDSTSVSQRWQAPEFVFGRSYTFKSTVWSLGILLWEIFILGGTPYVNHSTAEAVRKIRLANLRPTRPAICAGDNDEVYQLLLDCWLLQPEERPNMASIISNLESFALNPEIYFVTTPPPYFEPVDVEMEDT